MKLSDGEKLILVMLSEVYKKLGIKGEVDPEFVQSAIYSGCLWGIKWQYPGIFDAEEPTPGAVSEVGNVLDMWWLMEIAYTKLTAADKAKVAKGAEPLGKDVKFLGFDGNDEGEHMGIARFLIEDLGRFTHFKGRELNSHMPSLDGYRRMYEIFEPMRKTLADRNLSVDELVALLRARMHPLRR